MDFIFSYCNALFLLFDIAQIKLFTDADIENMFDIFDITGRGFLDDGQVAKALQAVGIKKPISGIPGAGKINRRMFLDYM